MNTVSVTNRFLKLRNIEKKARDDGENLPIIIVKVFFMIFYYYFAFHVIENVCVYRKSSERKETSHLRQNGQRFIMHRTARRNVKAKVK